MAEGRGAESGEEGVKSLRSDRMERESTGQCENDAGRGNKLFAVG